MGKDTSVRFVAVAAILAAISGAAVAQTQNQPQQNQNQQQSQQAQTQKKKSFWDKLKESAAQGAQNTMQQGTNAAQGTVQQGTNAAQGAVQQGTNTVQNGAQQMQGGAQPGMQQAAFPGSQGNGAFSGGGGGAGACGSSCFDAGPFQANVSQMTMSQQGPWHIIRMNIQFHNSTNQPLVIAYHEGSMVMVDNNGASYQGAGGQPGELQGMGIDRGNQTDSQFVLGPGQTGSALFSTARYRDQTSPVGTGYSYNFTIDELQAQNGAMAIPVRSYNLNFPSLAPSTVGGNAAFASGASPAMGFAGTNTKASSVGGAVMRPQGAAPMAAPTAQPRAVNARATATPTGTVSNAAIKAPATAAKPSAAVRPIPATTAKTTTPAKKTTTANTTTTTSR